MKDSGAGKLHYARFATRWKSIAELRGERATLILSPHLDDIFLSLYATIVSGRLGKNLIGVNFFTSSDSTVSTSVKTTFATIAKTSMLRMREELAFSETLFLQGINYLPVFMGLKDASIEKYYRFIAGGAIGRLSAGGVKSVALKLYDRMVSGYAEELQAGKAMAPLLRQFKSNIKSILVPMGVGTHVDHGVIARMARELSGAAKIGLYAEIPYVYLSGNLSIEKLRRKLPSGFSRSMVTPFDPVEKDRTMKKIYSSQYEKRMKEAIFAASKNLGEVIFWES
ncbi:MAG: hypothetical protein KGH57_00065 [Candidatus Micrarchaeota archaeon]|nr:hypothetical protein [Candidatus Micrarchaeota archaeon]